MTAHLNYQIPTINEAASTWGAKVEDALQKIDDASFTSAQAYGADPTGVADSTAAIQAAMAAIPGGVVLCPFGTYLYSSPLAPVNGTVIQGAGNDPTGFAGPTRLRYTGADAAVRLDGKTGVAFRDLVIQCTNIAATGVDFRNGAGCDSNEFSNVSLRGAGTAGGGVAIKMAGQTTCNCENVFRLVTISNWTTGSILSGFANANLFEQVVWETIGSYAIDFTLYGTDTLLGTDNVFLRCEVNGGVVNGVRLGSPAARNLFLLLKEDGVTTTGLSIASGAANNVFIACGFTGTVMSSDVSTLFLACTGITPASGFKGANIQTGISSIPWVLDGDHGGNPSQWIRNRNTADGRAITQYTSDRGATYSWSQGIDPAGGSVKDFGVRNESGAGSPIPFRITAANSVELAQRAAVVTTATDGFPYIPTCAGTPTGVPTARAGLVPMVYDTTANKLWIYNGGWKAATHA